MVVDDASSANIAVRTQRINEGHVYHPISYAMLEVKTPHYPIPLMVIAILETCPLPPTPMPSEGVYTYPYMPPPMVPRPHLHKTK